MRDKLPYFVVVFLYQVLLVKAQTTAETILLETTTEYVTVVTDIPKSDVELAMNLDYDTYTTEIFPYINSQYDRSQLFEKCFDDYTKCLITQGPAHPVCGMNNPSLPQHERQKGFIQFNSYCDVYFDNCKKQMRFWRILDIGKCTFTKFGHFQYFDIAPTRKFLENLPLFLKKILKSIRKLLSSP